MSASEAHFLHSSRREKILENIFIGEVLRELWRRKIYDAELLQSDIDAAGYDLVLSLDSGIRHIQLKAATKPKSWAVNGKIVDKPSGCVIVILVADNLSIEGFLWFGNELGKPCDNIRELTSAKHSKGDATGKKAERKDTYKMGVSKFTKLNSFEAVVNALKGNEI